MPLPEPSPPLLFDATPMANLQWAYVVSADHLARPHAIETACATPPTPVGVAMPTVDAQLGQDSTDNLQTCHLAVELP
jgi:hypothetical protein